jgi:hypothetical protein
MTWIYNKSLLLVVVALLTLTGCSISYRFNGGTIDYTQIKSIAISDVTNRAAIVYPRFAGSFTEALKDMYTSRTRLAQRRGEADLELECTITGYDLSTASVGQDNFADRTKFTVTMQVKYTNRVNPKESFDRSFTAYRDFRRDQQFNAVQDQLLAEITEDLTKQIFNATVENW